MKRWPSPPALVAALVLAAALCQVGLGARLDASGEQVGLALPVATLALGLATVWFLVWSRALPLPVLSRGQVWFLALACVGLFGMTRHEIPQAAKEVVQLIEVLVLAPYLFQQLVRRAGWPAVRKTLAGGCVGLLLLGASGLHHSAILKLSDAKLAAFVVLSLPFWFAAMVTFPPVRFWMAMAGTGLLTGLAVSNGGLFLCWLVLLVILCLRFRKGGAAAVLAVALAGLAGWWAALPVAVDRGPAPEARAANSVVTAVVTGVAAHPFNPWKVLNPQFDAQHRRRSVIEAAAAWQAPRYFPFGGGLGTYRRTINTLRQYRAEQPSPLDMKVPRDGNNQFLVLLVESGLPAALALVFLLLGAVAGRGLRKTGTDPEADEQAVTIGSALLGALLAANFCVILSRGIGIWVGALLGLAAWRAAPVVLLRPWHRALVPAVMAVAGLVVLAFCNTRLDRQQRVSTANRAARRLLFHDDIAFLPTVRVLELPDAVPGAAATDLIQVEAESCASLTPPFIKVPANDASGGFVLAIPDLAGKGDGRAVYAVTLPEDGTYTLEARVFWDDGCSNSLQFQVGDTAITLASEMFKQWHVLDAAQRLPLRKGALTVTVLNLEDGVKLDWWVLRRCGNTP